MIMFIKRCETRVYYCEEKKDMIYVIPFLNNQLINEKKYTYISSDLLVSQEENLWINWYLELLQHESRSVHGANDSLLLRWNMTTPNWRTGRIGQPRVVFNTRFGGAWPERWMDRNMLRIFSVSHFHRGDMNITVTRGRSREERRERARSTMAMYTTTRSCSG